MKEFIQLTDAFDGKLLLIRRSVISKVEETAGVVDGKEIPVCKITFLDNQLREEYVTESFKHIADVLNNTRLHG